MKLFFDLLSDHLKMKAVETIKNSVFANSHRRHIKLYLIILYCKNVFNSDYLTPSLIIVPAHNLTQIDQLSSKLYINSTLLFLFPMPFTRIIDH